MHWHHFDYHHHCQLPTATVIVAVTTPTATVTVAVNFHCFTTSTDIVRVAFAAGVSFTQLGVATRRVWCRHPGMGLGTHGLRDSRCGAVLETRVAWTWHP